MTCCWSAIKQLITYLMLRNGMSGSWTHNLRVTGQNSFFSLSHGVPVIVWFSATYGVIDCAQMEHVFLSRIGISNDIAVMVCAVNSCNSYVCMPGWLVYVVFKFCITVCSVYEWHLKILCQNTIYVSLGLSEIDDILKWHRNEPHPSKGWASHVYRSRIGMRGRDSVWSHFQPPMSVYPNVVNYGGARG